MITVVVLLFFMCQTGKAMIKGFGEEEIEELSASTYVGMEFLKMGASEIIMSTIGAIQMRQSLFLLLCVKLFIVIHLSAGKGYSHLE